VDLLGEVLLSATIEANSIGIFHANDEWGFAMPEVPASMVFAYSVVGPPCWLLSPGDDPIRLNHGDSVLILHGHAHALASEPGAPLTPLLQYWEARGLPDFGPETRRQAPIHFGFDGSHSAPRLLAIAYFLRDPAHSPLLSILPSTILLRESGSGHFPWLPATLEFLAAEKNDAKAGYLATATHLAELIFSSFLRAHVLSAPTLSPNWVRGLSDAQIGRALAAIHARPERNWTMAALAAEVGMSRPTFARRFSELVGQTPASYLLAWRMHVAAEHIVARKESISAIAERVGYSSEAAFRHVFKRRFGLSPLKYAKQHSRNTSSSSVSGPLAHAGPGS